MCLSFSNIITCSYKYYYNISVSFLSTRKSQSSPAFPLLESYLLTWKQYYTILCKYLQREQKDNRCGLSYSLQSIFYILRLREQRRRNRGTMDTPEKTQISSSLSKFEVMLFSTPSLFLVCFLFHCLDLVFVSQLTFIFFSGFCLLKFG